MASLDRINSEIAQLEQATQAIAQEFRDAYTQYLTVLAKAMQQQLILASFRLCTQGYPDRFLKLSFNERQTLQQALQQVGQQAIEQLMLPLQEPSENQEFEQTDADEIDRLNSIDCDEEEFDEMLFAPQADDRDRLEIDETNDSEFNSEAETDEAEAEETESEDEDDLLEVTILQLRFDEPIPPKALQQWREGVEANVAIVLQTISQAANRLLHQAKILPKPLPPVLEVAAQTGIVAETASSTPNLLNLLIDTSGGEATKMTQMIAIRLRLAEIEFADPALATGRSQIRSLSARLQQLERNYRKKQRDRAVAEAEAAWRSAWYEE